MNAISIIVDGQNGKLSRQLPTLYFADDSAVNLLRRARELLPLIKCDSHHSDLRRILKNTIPLYGWLANAAAQVLPIGGNLLAMAGQSYLPRSWRELSCTPVPVDNLLSDSRRAGGAKSGRARSSHSSEASVAVCERRTYNG